MGHVIDVAVVRDPQTSRRFGGVLGLVNKKYGMAVDPKPGVPTPRPLRSAVLVDLIGHLFCTLSKVNRGPQVFTHKHIYVAGPSVVAM